MCDHFFFFFWAVEVDFGWVFRHGRNVLDLSLSMRFANLVQGAKLVLIPVKNDVGKQKKTKSSLCPTRSPRAGY